jgi:hypothetical protein
MPGHAPEVDKPGIMPEERGDLTGVHMHEN